MKTLRPSRLGREIAVLLTIKLILIIAIKVTFFSSPVKPGTEGTAQALLSPHPTERNPSHE